MTGTVHPWTGAFAGLCAAVLLTFTAFGAAVPVLPRLITTELGGSALAVGTAFGISAVAALLSRPYAGRLAQRGDVRLVIAAAFAGHLADRPAARPHTGPVRAPRH
ncbi:hypothetical protein ACGFNU_14625 [Spirillospora sp. NPDC048911]|uniref:hypothetical protein n=1 Tax=Spirillospora sp. NPDC048911 TaxID=3364527 RepID=UPI0037127077